MIHLEGADFIFDIVFRIVEEVANEGDTHLMDIISSDHSIRCFSTLEGIFNSCTNMSIAHHLTIIVYRIYPGNHILVIHFKPIDDTAELIILVMNFKATWIIFVSDRVVVRNDDPKLHKVQQV